MNTNTSDLLILPLSPIVFGLYMRVIALATKPTPSSPPPTSQPPSPSRPSPPSRLSIPSRTPLPSRLPAPMPRTTANTNTRHPDYYITSADFIIRVENTLFRIHRYFFVRDSEYFRENLSYPPPPGDQSPGSSDKKPFVLPKTSKVEFERFLWVFYNPKYSLYDANVEEWTSVLKLADLWAFVEAKELAVRQLQALSIDPVERILLYRKYTVKRGHFLGAFTELTIRDQPINNTEGQKLGLETVVQLADARERTRAPVSPGNRSGVPRSPITHTGPQLDDIIKDSFKLTTSPTMPQTPTGRNTHADSDSAQSSPQSDWSDSFMHNSSEDTAAEGHTNGTTNSDANSTNHTPWPFIAR